jgi:hypothetical protein
VGPQSARRTVRDMTTRAALSIICLVLAACNLVAPPAEPLTGAATPVPPATEATAGAGAPMPAEPIPEDCVNPPPDLMTLIEQNQAVACYGSAGLTVEAHAVLFMGVADCPGELHPAWFGCGGVMVDLYSLGRAAGPMPAIVLAARSPNRGPALSAVIHPEYDIDLHRGLDTAVTVTGHFDDPLASTCRYRSWPDAQPPSRAETVAMCRGRFVITHLNLLELSG